MTATITKAAYDLANDSFGRCCNSDGFFDSFYSILRASNPDIARMFARTDFTKQNELLRVGLDLMLMYDHDNDAANQIMAKIRMSHSRHRLDVKPEFYHNWIDSLMVACEKHDANFTSDIENAWREVLAKGIDYIKSGYNEGAGKSECLSYLHWLDPDLEAVARQWCGLSKSIRDELVAKVRAAN